MKVKAYKDLLAYQKSYEVTLLGSNAELETQLSLSRDLNYVSEGKFKKVYELNEEVGRLLSSYISRLQNSAWLLPAMR